MKVTATFGNQLTQKKYDYIFSQIIDLNIYVIKPDFEKNEVSISHSAFLQYENLFLIVLEKALHMINLFSGLEIKNLKIEEFSNSPKKLLDPLVLLKGTEDIIKTNKFQIPFSITIV